MHIPGCYLILEIYFHTARAYVDPAAAEEDGTNAFLAEAVGKYENMRPSTLLKGEYASGTTSYRVAQLK